MTLSYSEDGEYIDIESDICPNCQNTNTRLRDGGYWKCEDCSTVWAYDKHDPDYDEPDLCTTCNGRGNLIDDTECPACGGIGYL
jgi:DnaJ-class molecular chaperone